MDKISIIVPVFNVADYLPQCLDSLINQSYPDVEIICVNDGSSDNSADVLREYQAMNDKITVITQANSGVSVARNAGLDAAIGDWIMFVDSDDWIDLNTCDQMIDMATREKSDVVMCSYVKEYAGRSEEVHIFSGDSTPKIPGGGYTVSSPTVWADQRGDGLSHGSGHPGDTLHAAVPAPFAGRYPLPGYPRNRYL